MRTGLGGALLMAAAALAVLGRDDSKQRDSHTSKPKPAARLQACVEAWNRDANFKRGSPGALVRRLERRSADPLFAHVSRDGRQRCVVFVDTVSDVDDGRFVRFGGRFELDCGGPCGDQAPAGSRTLRFLENGSLPSLARSKRSAEVRILA